MSDSRPIGIFDSGLGGLTVAKEIYHHLPHESTIYIGDTARVPYGNRSPETIISFSRQMVSFLLTKNVKAIVVACATASSTSLTVLQQDFPNIPIIGVIDAAAKKATEITPSGNIGILATRATIKSQSFVHAINMYSKQGIVPSKITSLACPLFVPIIEEGILSGAIIESVAQHYVHQLGDSSIKTIILGCTHYPLITPIIQQLLPSVHLINLGAPTANALESVLGKNKIESTNTPTHEYYATDVTENFTRVANLFLESAITINHYHLSS